MELTLNEIKQLEELLRKATDVDFPFYGRIDTIWVGDKIDRIDKIDQRKVKR